MPWLGGSTGPPVELTLPRGVRSLSERVAESAQLLDSPSEREGLRLMAAVPVSWGVWPEGRLRELNW
jgi:hypothetical protein